MYFNSDYKSLNNKNMKISIFTTMTEPEKRMDPWKEALDCYKEFSDEVVVVGENWPKEFSFEYIGQTFQEGFDKSTGDWVVRMDVDTFFHEKDMNSLRAELEKYQNFPGVVFPKYQFFKAERFHVKAKMCVAFNKKKFPRIELNGGGDLCDPMLNGKILDQNNLPNINIPIWNYDSTFKNKEIISEDRARFARAWNRCFGEWGDRGGDTSELAYEAWIEMIKKRYKLHVVKMDIKKHPKYIKERLSNLSEDLFGHSLFGHETTITRNPIHYYKGYKDYFLSK